MLDIAPPTNRNIMSVDCSPYLLSASPPGSSLNLYTLSLAFSDYCGFRTCSTCASNTADGSEVDNQQAWDPHEEHRERLHVSRQGEGLCLAPKRRDWPLESSAIGGGAASSLGGEGSDSLLVRASFGGMQKRVHFADSVGKPLVEVRTMLEASSDPPRLSIVADDLEDSIGFSPLRLNFAQPCVNFLEFDRKLQTNMVTVENVYVDEYKVEGTIFVRGISSQKEVFVRFTIDSWDSHCDVEAKYINKHGPHDRYQFQFVVPSSADRSKTVEFAACFTVDGVQHWDSNEGVNFPIAWETEEPGFAEDTYEYDMNLNNNCAVGWWLDN